MSGPSRFDRTAGRYAAEAATRDWSGVVELCRAAPDDRALDVGAGPGMLSAALAPHVREAVALDASAALLDHAPAGVVRVVGDATAMPFDDGAFPIVTCVNVLHHVAEPDRVLAEMARVLGPDGRLVIQDYLADPDPEAAARWDDIERLRAHDHHRLPQEGEVAAALAGHGLRADQERAWDSHWDVGAWCDLAGCDAATTAQVRELIGAPTYSVRAWRARFVR